MIAKIKKETLYFIRSNITISVLVGISTLIVIGYIISMDLPELWHNAGNQFEVLYQVSLSIVASFLFYVMQVYIPERKKKKSINPYIIILVEKIADSMNTIIEELSICYLKNKVSISEITEEQLQVIINNYSANDETTIQVCFEIRNISNAEMMDLIFKEIETNIDKLTLRYIGFMDEELEILIRNIYNCKMQKLFSQSGNALMSLVNVKGISGNAALDTFKDFKHLHYKLIEYIEASKQLNY